MVTRQSGPGTLQQLVPCYTVLVAREARTRALANSVSGEGFLLPRQLVSCYPPILLGRGLGGLLWGLFHKGVNLTPK